MKKKKKETQKFVKPALIVSQCDKKDEQQIERCLNLTVQKCLANLLRAINMQCSNHKE